MKKIILIILIVLELSLIKIPTYNELNNLAIIEEITIIKENKNYQITLKEIIPEKDNNTINYKYEYHQESGTNIKEIINKINSKSKKELYLNKVKSLKTNIKNSNQILKNLNINPKTIIHL